MRTLGLYFIEFNQTYQGSVLLNDVDLLILRVPCAASVGFRKEEGYGTTPTFNVSILMGKRDVVLHQNCPPFFLYLSGLTRTS